ncbi:MAG TPA: HD domain-containing phosphohydrolase [Burkholderiaceae bacterium]|nr:HD domain-containing phosphohydrolase [Burkholderiaceae bacterium]
MIRLAELVAALSLATDLGMGQPIEHQHRTCALALALAAELAVEPRELSDVYYLSLLRWIGCTSHAHELATWFDDEIAAHSRAASFELERPLQVVLDVLRHAGAGRSPLRRIGAIADALVGGRELPGLLLSSCEVAQRLSAEIGAPAGVQHALSQVFERWDGRGPAGLRAEQICLPVRIVRLAGDAEYFRRERGLESAVAVVRARAGKVYDPRVAAAFCAHAERLTETLQQASTRAALLEAEPGPPVWLEASELPQALEAIADLSDLKSPWLAGHSRGVAALAADAAKLCGLPAPQVEVVRGAGLLHDLGRIGVPSGIWDRAGPLTEAQWHRVQLHTFHADRILDGVAALAPVRAIVAAHHERVDGSGYHRRLPGPMLSLHARLLSAADACRAITEDRPHRPARSLAQTADELRRDVQRGRLDARAVDAVLEAAGQRRRGPRLPRARALSPREIEVLQWLVRGESTRQIAQRLRITAKTADHHVQHIYSKLGVRSRAAAAVYAMQNGLLDPPSDS